MLSEKLRKLACTYLRFPCVIGALLFLSQTSIAQEQSFFDSSEITAQLPDAQSVHSTQRRIRSSMEEVDKRISDNKVILPDLPRVESVPQPLVPSKNLSDIAGRFKDINVNKSRLSRKQNLFILVSLSMPTGALNKLVEQAEKAGATLVFRGAKGDSMAEMGKEIAKIIGTRNVQIIIHPAAFQQFSVKHVPAFVLASEEAGKTLDDGCSKPESFVKVSGDVTLDYALDYIERNDSEWSKVAEAFRSRIIRGL